MPSFDYRCDECGDDFEAQVATSRSRPACPRCGSRRSRRLPAAPALHTSSSIAPSLKTCGGSGCGCGAVDRPRPASARS